MWRSKVIGLLSLTQLACCVLLNANVAEAAVLGKLSGDLSVSQGMLGYQLALPVPNGIHEINPNLSISYQQAGMSGILGSSFSLSASSAITRCTPNRENDGFESGIQIDALTRFCHDGQKLVSVSGQDGKNGAEYRSFNNNNIRYVSHGGSDYTPDTWVLNTPSGYELTFERHGQPNNQFAAWFLTSKKDFFDNEMTYQYSISNSPRLEQISYSGYVIDFDYIDKENTVGQYQDSVYVSVTKLLNKITVTSPNGELFYFYDFGYEVITSPVAVERLEQVTRCYAGTGAEGNSACLKPVRFTYKDLPNSAVTVDQRETDLTMIVPSEHYKPAGGIDDLPIEQRPSFVAGDVTGNGFDDFCYYKVGQGILCAEYDDGSYTAPRNWSADLGYEANEEDHQAYGLLRLIDINVDGKADFCLLDDTGLRCGISSGSGFENIAYWNTTLSKSNSAISLNYVDSDSFVDVCGLDESMSYICFTGNGSSFMTELNNFGNVDFVRKNEWQLESCSGETCWLEDHDYESNLPSAMWLDIDGDYDQDLCWVSDSLKGYVCRYAETDPNTKTLVYGLPVLLMDLSAFISTLPASPASIVDNMLVHQNLVSQSEEAVDIAEKLVSGFRLSNLNGDQLPDLCFVEGLDLKCAINNGSGFLDATIWSSLDSLLGEMTGDELKAKISELRFVDRNRDGAADLCIIHSEIEKCGTNIGDSFGEFQERLNIYPDIVSDLNEQRVWGSFMHKLFGGHRLIVNQQVVRSAYGNLLEVHDLNGDGYSEFCYRSIWGIVCSTNDNYGPSALLTGVTDSFGLTSTVTYESLLHDQLYDYATTIPEGFHESPPNILVVSYIETETAVADNYSGDKLRNRVDYRYGAYLVNQAEELSGFTKMTQTQSE